MGLVTNGLLPGAVPSKRTPIWLILYAGEEALPSRFSFRRSEVRSGGLRTCRVAAPREDRKG